MKVQPPEAVTPFVAYHPSGDERFAVLDRTIEQYGAHPDALIQVLHMAQQLFGYLSSDVLRYVAASLKIPIALVYGVVSFYHLFALVPRGKHQIMVCRGTTCHVRGAAQILERLEQQLGVKESETTKDNVFSLHSARCIGACALAPAIAVDDDVYGKLTPDKIPKFCQKDLKKYV
ncbi:MAG: NAD(P)H-dependent oxidoreductase subunit E [Verrucomicrobia bacterium]|nr:NAD(P)H-dependent oxidoreductase subunit E [Verrucomicrobiota bacterium]